MLNVDDDVDLIEFCYEQGWTDGLPVVPPTPEKVAAAIAASGRSGRRPGLPPIPSVSAS